MIRGSHAPTAERLLTRRVVPAARRPLLPFPVLLATVLALAPGALPAQSLTAGLVRGEVEDQRGEPLARVELTLTDRGTRLVRHARTDRRGRFAFEFVPAGDYEVRAEKIGYRPAVVLGVRIGAGATVELTLRLLATAPPVRGVDTLTFAGGGVARAWAVLGEFADLADPSRTLRGVAGVVSTMDAEQGAEGLPGRLGALALDGLARRAARHPADGGAFDAWLAPLTGLAYAEHSSANDVEWPGVGGGLLLGDTRPAGRRISGRVQAEAGRAFRASGLVSGPIVRDTAAFVIGGAFSRLEADRPAAWTGDSVGLALDTVARDSFNTDLSRYLATTRARVELANAFARFDWAVGAGQLLSVRAEAARLTAADADLGPAATARGTRFTARDVSAAATLASRLSETLHGELRVGVDASEQVHDPATLAPRTLLDGRYLAGGGDVLPGSFNRSAVQGRATLHARLGTHHLKFGLALERSAHEQQYTAGRGGVYAFGGVDEFARREGAFSIAQGTIPVASFSTTESAVFMQDLWTPAPGVELLLGLRYAREALPVGDIPRNAAWLASTGLANDSVTGPPGRIMPRLGLRWATGRDRQWLVRADAGLYREPYDPALMAELLSGAGGVLVRRGTGLLGAWPTAPDTIAAPVVGQRLAVTTGRVELPRTGRVQLAIERRGARTGVRLSGTYRHTDFLPRRRDLNLLPAPSATDSLSGRPIYGTLQQYGALVVGRPGTSRRFTGFDLVSGLEPTGYSDYYGLSVGFDHQVVRGLALLASYTYSVTHDNWLGAAGSPEEQLSPLADSATADAWADGRSDFDVPHRVSVGAELRLPGRLGVRIATLYRRRSGLPYTPGFAPGVDVNGDGASNDPAFVVDTIPGMTALLAEHECLRAQLGRMAERNACRAPGVSQLDVRLRLTLPIGPTGAELTVDGLNLLDPETGPVNRALYLVDRTGAITTDAAAGRVIIPLVANPAFGRTLSSRRSGALWRVGVAVSF
jgi:hypothetical protein